ncbi:DNA cytosine methyltransferase [Thalassospira xianhensis]|uniref:DNA (cytosine-5-)-methyltransferase n=1 Tax=Thalassospira xianhensis MCCC 1A02616 TaxID=1177929 RepID=A0A367UK76_9PROT|nr:DNA (cytosine-5-)-methyltransferase [Thalassospira xianhensis]RCK07734.1 hypothetical protein TH5_01320 [Thalassospira xianhensis MCCC 1A02616]
MRTCIELFAGCGGLLLGSSYSGLRHSHAFEFNRPACDTLRINAKHHHADVIRTDVRQVDWEKYRGEVPLVLTGGPPCQPFSMGGKHSGYLDARDMWPEAIRAVRELRPEGFIFENVKGLLRPAFKDYVKWVTASLEHPSVETKSHDKISNILQMTTTAVPEYEVTILTMNAADFGVPQQRHRVFLVGVRAGMNTTPLDIDKPTPTHGEAKLVWDKWVTGSYWARHGISTPTCTPTKREAGILSRLQQSNSEPTGAAWVTVRDALGGLGEPDGINQHVFQSGARIYPGHTGSPLDLPAKALKAGTHGVPGGENMMVKDDGTVRYFTVREAATLQGFPDSWYLSGAWSENMRQIGNAVPVALASTVSSWLTAKLAGGEVACRAA